ncbi:MAG: YdbH domain-containing protein [Rhodospirillales bacterium]|jgi:hypothetical protein|nr:YdbH domain-containing protein [Rhodospirillales bacterium]
MDASRKRRFSLIALAGAGFLLALLWALPDIIALNLPQILRQAGFKEVSLGVVRAGWTRLELENVALDKALSAKRLAIGFTPFGLSSLEARNLAIIARTDGKSLSLGPITLPLAGGGSGGGLPDIRLDQAKFKLETPLGQLNGLLNTETKGTSTRLRLDLSSDSQPALVAPLILTGIAGEDADGLHFAGKLNDPLHRFLIKLSANQDAKAGTQSGDMILERVEFEPGGLQLADISPLLARHLKNVSGPLEGRLALTKEGGKTMSEARLSSPGLSFESHGAVVRNLMGTLSLDRLWPPRTPAPQNFSLGLLSVGVPLGSGSFAFGLEEDGGIFIKRAALNLADGKLRLEPVRIGPDLTGTLVFQASDVDLAKLAPWFQLPGMTLGGTVDGAIPVILDKDGLKVAEAKLSAREKGFVRYRPESLPRALQDQGEAVSLMTAALRNFQYDSLALALDGQAGGETTVAFHIKGRNPDLHDGTPFEFNFRLTGPLDSLARQAYGIVSLPGQFEAKHAELR